MDKFKVMSCMWHEILTSKNTTSISLSQIDNFSAESMTVVCAVRFFSVAIFYNKTEITFRINCVQNTGKSGYEAD